MVIPKRDRKIIQKWEHDLFPTLISDNEMSETKERKSSTNLNLNNGKYFK
jgi:hypothetical protein